VSLSGIRQALAYHVENLGLEFPLSYPGQEFTPPNTGAYGAVDFVFTQPNAVTLGKTGEDNHVGYLQLTLNKAAASGDGWFYTVADSVRQQSQGGQVVTYNGQSVTIVSCGIGLYDDDDGRLKAAITIYWRARTTRNLA